MTQLVTTAHDLVTSAIDLTRACAASELYLPWLTTHSKGSAFVADYLCRAALSFHLQSTTETVSFDPFAARETFADLLMASAPLSNVRLAAAAQQALHDAIPETAVAPCTARLRGSRVRVVHPPRS